MPKGDTVKALLDIGSGNVIERIFEADKNGRNVNFRRDDKKGVYEVTIETAAGTTIRQIDLRADRVIMIEEVSARA